MAHFQLEKSIVSPLLKKCSVPYETLVFIAVSQKPADVPCPELYKSSSNTHTIFILDPL